MAENQEKTEAELLEEAMQNLGLEEVVEEKKSDELVEGGSKLTDEDIESLIKDDEPEKKEEIPETQNVEPVIEEVKIKDELSDVDDINLNNSSLNDTDEIVDNSELNEEEFDVQKKQSKVVRILIIVISILLTLVSIGVVLYFIGFFDPKPVKVTKKENVEKNIEPKKEEYKFNPTDIDTNRLNKKLNLLTKYEIVESSSTEEKKAKEKENLYLEAKKQLEAERQAEIEKIKEAERKRLEETLPPIKKENIDQNIDKEIDKVITKEDSAVTEPITTPVAEQPIAKTEDTTKPTEEVPNKQATENTPAKPVVEEVKKVDEPQVTTPPEPAVENPPKEQVVVTEEKPKESQFVKVIKIAIKSQNIYKSFLDKIYSVDDKVTLCRDYQNNIEVFIGPFEDDITRGKIAEEYLLKYNIKTEIYDYTKEEYNKRCNY